ncbi:MAG: glutamate--tRNA ligase family protein [Oligoflexales bacterium]
MMHISSSLITRFAPSPTGPLHIGNLVSAIYVWGIAKKYGGKVILRIEDHDRQRSKSEWVQMILEDLKWLKMQPDEISIQSEHLNRFAKSSDKLIKSGKAYFCHCTRKDILKKQPGHAQELYYNGNCRNHHITPNSIDGIRFIVTPENIAWKDSNLGPQTDAPHQQCGDFLIKDRKGNWTYQFAVTVDDIHENVNLIIRGEDLRDSSARQILLAQELLPQQQRPIYFHHPLIIDKENQKLSKRTRSTHIREFSRKPEELLGLAAFQCGLLPKPKPLSSEELPQLFQHINLQHY